MPGMPSEWLAFQDDNARERCRLIEFPPNWAELSDERLDLLRRSCTPVPLITGTHSPPGGIERVQRTGADGEKGEKQD